MPCLIKLNQKKCLEDCKHYLKMNCLNIKIEQLEDTFNGTTSIEKLHDILFTFFTTCIEINQSSAFKESKDSKISLLSIRNLCLSCLNYRKYLYYYLNYFLTHQFIQYISQEQIEDVRNFFTLFSKLCKEGIITVFLLLKTKYLCLQESEEKDLKESTFYLTIEKYYDLDKKNLISTYKHPIDVEYTEELLNQIEEELNKEYNQINCYYY